MLGMLFVIEWSISIAFENSLIGIQQKIFFAKLGYIGVYGCVPFFLLFIIYFIGKDQWITRNRIIALLFIPLLMILLAWTNEYHYLIWSGIELDPDPTKNLLIYFRGPLYWLGVIYNYVQFVIMVILLIRQIIIRKDVFRKQAIMVLLGLLPVVLANFNYMAASGPLRGMDLTTVGFSLMCLFFYLGITNQKLFQFIPIPKEAILDGIQDGIVVLDGQNSIIDCNPAAEKFFNGNRWEIIGKQVDIALKPYPELLSLLGTREDFTQDLYINDPEMKVICVQCREIIGTNQNILGRMISFQDITSRKQIEEIETEQRLEAEAFKDVMVALTSTLEFDEVLDRIMENIHKVMPYGMTNLVLIDKQDIGRVVRCIGYEDKGLLEWVKSVEFPIKEVSSYRQMDTTGKPFIVPDTHLDKSWLKKNDFVHSYMGAPIQIKGRTLGFINQDHKDPNFFTPDQAERLQTFADLAAIALENARLFKLTQEMAIIDELTGLNNRRNFFQLASNEVKRSIRYSKPCSLVIFDIDNFKEINDLFGHPVGDQALRNSAKTLIGSVRDIDICGRYGGDEFCILLPETDLKGAKVLTKRVLEDLRALTVRDNSNSKKITASFGIAELDEGTITVDDLLNHADYALYQAKQNGRDRIEVWDEKAQRHRKKRKKGDK